VLAKQKTSRYNDIDMLNIHQFEFQNHQEPPAGANLRILNSNSTIPAKIKKSSKQLSPDNINQPSIGTRKNKHKTVKLIETNRKNCSSNQSVGRSNGPKDKSTLHNYHSYITHSSLLETDELQEQSPA
jgi:hypothetical protein